MCVCVCFNVQYVFVNADCDVLTCACLGEGFELFCLIYFLDSLLRVSLWLVVAPLESAGMLRGFRGSNCYFGTWTDLDSTGHA